MADWTLQDFEIGDISFQIIEFTVENYIYVMLFNRVCATRTQEVIDEKSGELDIDYRENSYEVNFVARMNLGDEGLDYEITTPDYKS